MPSFVVRGGFDSSVLSSSSSPLGLRGSESAGVGSFGELRLRLSIVTSGLI
jgi:hypothetical protein